VWPRKGPPRTSRSWLAAGDPSRRRAAIAVAPERHGRGAGPRRAARRNGVSSSLLTQRVEHRRYVGVAVRAQELLQCRLLGVGNPVAAAVRVEGAQLLWRNIELEAVAFERQEPQVVADNHCDMALVVVQVPVAMGRPVVAVDKVHLHRPPGVDREDVPLQGEVEYPA